jgi:MFS family permease
MWYRKTEQGRRTGYWLSCNGITLIVTAGVGYVLSAITDAAVASWKILFLILGLLTVATGVVCYFYMPDSLLNAWFLSPRQKAIAGQCLKDNFQGM